VDVVIGYQQHFHSLHFCYNYRYKLLLLFVANMGLPRGSEAHLSTLTYRTPSCFLYG
jgi:hypothetical protein